MAAAVLVGGGLAEPDYYRSYREPEKRKKSTHKRKHKGSKAAKRASRTKK